MKRSQQNVPENSAENMEESPCVMAVFYEDTPARGRAVNLCHRLTGENLGAVPLAVSWWKFNCLEEPRLAHDATQAARNADIILVVTTSQNPLPQVVADAIQRCARLRSKPDGLIAALVHQPEKSAGHHHPVIQKLKSLASIAEIDFLPDITHEVSQRHHELLERIEHRAHDISRTLRESMQPHNRSRF